MWTSSLSSWFARFVLLACLAFAVTQAWGSDSAKPAGTPKATQASGVGQGGRETADLPNASSAKRVDDSYVIGRSDVLATNVWKDPEISRTVPVRPDGRISLPLIGGLMVSGLTAPNVQYGVAPKLGEYIIKPEATVIAAQSALAAAPVPAQAAVYPGAQTPLGYAGETAPANLRPFRRDSRAIFDDNVFSINQPRVGDEASSLGPNTALPEPGEYQEISLNYSPSLLLCPPIHQLGMLNQGPGPGSSCRSGAGYMLGLHDSQSYLHGGVQPIPGEQTVSGHRLATNLDSKDRTSPAMTRVDTPSLDALHSRSKEHDAMAFQEVAPQSGSGRHAVRDKVALIILSSAVHAAVTWDAQSTDHFFQHYPNGFRPIEADPLMRPFAGKALMYPMMNLFFAVPVDLLLLKTRHSQKPIRILTYAAASGWAGLEIRQSIINMSNEHLTLAPGIEGAKAIARMK